MPARAERGATMLAGVLLAIAAHGAEAPPDPGFLEFLGMLVAEEGDYLGPLDMAADGWSGDGADQRATQPPAAGRTAPPALEGSDHATRD